MTAVKRPPYDPVMPVSFHVKARTQRPPSYPPRFPVPDELVPWDVPYPAYAPPYFVDPEVLANDRTRNPEGWAEPEDFSRVRRGFPSYEGEVRRDGRGRPRNPRGRTGIEGRGRLGAWGANFAADPIVTRLAPGSLEVEMLVIKRRDTGDWAIPGGMVDAGEDVSRTLEREFEEEAGVRLDLSGAVEVFRGYVDDRRNTDNAWMETVAKHLHLDPALAEAMNPVAGDDAQDVRWARVTAGFLSTLYTDHGTFVRRALALAAGPEGRFPALAARRRAIEELLGSG